MKKTGTHYRQKTMAGIFRRYTVFFLSATVASLIVAALIFLLLAGVGVILPADYMERELKNRTKEIRETPEVTEELLPEGSRYGVYDRNGAYRYGTFEDSDREDAWSCYESEDIYPRNGGYYRFIVRDNGEVCIAKYYIGSRFNTGTGGRELPSPELVLPVIWFALVVIQLIVLSRYFGKYMKSRLDTLAGVTRKIQDQDLDFAREYSDLKEIDEVLDSLYKLKYELERSLEERWNLENRKNEQIAALAHDIKTPLTVIKGNAELIGEGEIPEQEAEYNEYILQSALTIEKYVGMLNELAAGRESTVDGMDQRSVVSCSELADRLVHQAKSQICGCRLQMDVQRGELKGSVTCNLSQIGRAWGNVIGNAIEYTPGGKCIRVCIDTVTEHDGRYLSVSAVDEGPGFGEQDLRYASERFYQGDKSRHDKMHHGLGLHTATVFAEAQGGRLELANTETHGARVTLYLRADPDTVC